MTPQCRPLAGMKSIRNRTVAGVYFFGKTAGSGRFSRSKVSLQGYQAKIGISSLRHALPFCLAGLTVREVAG